MKTKVIKFIFGTLLILIGATLVYASLWGRILQGDWSLITLTTSGIIIVIAGLILASGKTFKELMDSITNTL
ncbi:MAG TPA: hypothetical protein VLA77_03790 [Candidatus Saccharimonadales bacterium]|nr:hypothetical protein [Candidatus Saccharimonadales bacterium]